MTHWFVQGQCVCSHECVMKDFIRLRHTLATAVSGAANPLQGPPSGRPIPKSSDDG